MDELRLDLIESAWHCVHGVILLVFGYLFELFEFKALHSDLIVLFGVFKLVLQDGNFHFPEVLGSEEDRLVFGLIIFLFLQVMPKSAIIHQHNCIFKIERKTLFIDNLVLL
jgi:hypothetical protein